MTVAYIVWKFLTKRAPRDPCPAPPNRKLLADKLESFLATNEAIKDAYATQFVVLMDSNNIYALAHGMQALWPWPLDKEPDADYNKISTALEKTPLRMTSSDVQLILGSRFHLGLITKTDMDKHVRLTFRLFGRGDSLGNASTITNIGSLGSYLDSCTTANPCSDNEVAKFVSKCESKKKGGKHGPVPPFAVLALHVLDGVAHVQRTVSHCSDIHYYRAHANALKQLVNMAIDVGRFAIMMTHVSRTDEVDRAVMDDFALFVAGEDSSSSCNALPFNVPLLACVFVPELLNDPGVRQYMEVTQKIKTVKGHFESLIHDMLPEYATALSSAHVVVWVMTVLAWLQPGYLDPRRNKSAPSSSTEAGRHMHVFTRTDNNGDLKRTKGTNGMTKTRGEKVFSGITLTKQKLSPECKTGLVGYSVRYSVAVTVRCLTGFNDPALMDFIRYMKKQFYHKENSNQMESKYSCNARRITFAASSKGGGSSKGDESSSKGDGSSKEEMICMEYEGAFTNTKHDGTIPRVVTLARSKAAKQLLGPQPCIIKDSKLLARVLEVLPHIQTVMDYKGFTDAASEARVAAAVERLEAAFQTMLDTKGICGMLGDIRLRFDTDRIGLRTNVMPEGWGEELHARAREVNSGMWGGASSSQPGGNKAGGKASGNKAGGKAGGNKAAAAAGGGATAATAATGASASKLILHNILDLMLFQDPVMATTPYVQQQQQPAAEAMEGEEGGTKKGGTKKRKQEQQASAAAAKKRKEQKQEEEEEEEEEEAEEEQEEQEEQEQDDNCMMHFHDEEDEEEMQLPAQPPNTMAMPMTDVQQEEEEEDEQEDEDEEQEQEDVPPESNDVVVILCKHKDGKSILTGVPGADMVWVAYATNVVELPPTPKGLRTYKITGHFYSSKGKELGGALKKDTKKKETVVVDERSVVKVYLCDEEDPRGNMFELTQEDVTELRVRLKALAA